MAETEDSSQPKEVQAAEILNKIKNGVQVKYDGIAIVEDLDLSLLDLPRGHLSGYRSCGSSGDR